jgi:hypothetical protein
MLDFISWQDGYGDYTCNGKKADYKSAARYFRIINPEERVSWL